jgi:hypothetical protein
MMNVLRFLVVPVITGVVALFFIYPCIPKGESVRWLITGVSWVVLTGGLIAMIGSLRSLPARLRPLTLAALSGWLLACFAAAALASLWYAIFGMFHEQRTPEYWIWCRAALSALYLAILPAVAVVKLSHHLGHSSSEHVTG